jgi:hypothetical protein
MPATLTVNRNSPDDAQQREILVFLDGEQIAELIYGQSISKELSAGPHMLLVDNTWKKKSAQFTANEGDSITFLAWNRASRFSEFLLGIFGGGPLNVFLERK